ncbi:MAG TPA: flagellar basal body P-ring formation chaperone FlgA, partial [Thermoguttaceae bacterium]|nr:flagellar basal body P-ring formation chaperone FlgA [Thermoguttaceae bacterium]
MKKNWPFPRQISFWVQLFAGGMIALGAWNGLLDSAICQENAIHAGKTPEAEPADNAAVEIRLRPEADLAEPIVRLGDLAQFFPSQSPLAEQLAQLELFPSPAPGQRRYLSAMELEEILLRRGAPVRSVRLTGANQVEIRRGYVSSASQPIRLPRTASSSRRGVETILQDAIVAYLRQKVSSQAAWRVKAAAEDGLKDVFTDRSQLLEVRGGAPPWTGTQWFEVIVNTPQGPRSLVVQTEVSLPPSVVTAARPIPKGTVLQAQDLVLQPISGGEETDGYFQQIEDLIGKEALRGLPAGKPIPQDAVHAPTLVQRGQVVTVYARAPGIRVR